ncbi:hypothetical protein KFE25_013480 [Diacronema lutheri]|uniref:N-acetyltransferase domain-containing protein n=1 Tax=Diacronema lutheri TaxID=2081491 RepID=A0A8J6CB65_DIALT|nr:hypothetical protein KFE25_013480 [Diacronema lutheri]
MPRLSSATPAKRAHPDDDGGGEGGGTFQTAKRPTQPVDGRELDGLTQLCGASGTPPPMAAHLVRKTYGGRRSTREARRAKQLLHVRRNTVARSLDFCDGDAASAFCERDAKADTRFTPTDDDAELWAALRRVDGLAPVLNGVRHIELVHLSVETGSFALAAEPHRRFQTADRSVIARLRALQWEPRWRELEAYRLVVRAVEPGCAAVAAGPGALLPSCAPSQATEVMDMQMAGGYGDGYGDDYGDADEDEDGDGDGGGGGGQAGEAQAEAAKAGAWDELVDWADAHGDGDALLVAAYDASASSRDAAGESGEAGDDGGPASAPSSWRDAEPARYFAMLPASAGDAHSDGRLSAGELDEIALEGEPMLDDMGVGDLSNATATAIVDANADANATANGVTTNDVHDERERAHARGGATASGPHATAAAGACVAMPPPRLSAEPRRLPCGSPGAADAPVAPPNAPVASAALTAVDEANVDVGAADSSRAARLARGLTGADASLANLFAMVAAADARLDAEERARHASLARVVECVDYADGRLRALNGAFCTEDARIGPFPPSGPIRPPFFVHLLILTPTRPRPHPRARAHGAAADAHSQTARAPALGDDGGEAIGYVLHSGRSHSHDLLPELHHVYIAAAHRRRGHASRMLSWWVDRFAQHAFAFAVNEPNEQMRRVLSKAIVQEMRAHSSTVAGCMSKHYYKADSRLLLPTPED